MILSLFLPVAPDSSHTVTCLNLINLLKHHLIYITRCYQAGVTKLVVHYSFITSCTSSLCLLSCFVLTQCVDSLFPGVSVLAQFFLFHLCPDFLVFSLLVVKLQLLFENIMFFWFLLDASIVFWIKLCLLRS